MSDETQVEPPEGAAANVADPDATPTDGAAALSLACGSAIESDRFALS